MKLKDTEQVLVALVLFWLALMIVLFIASLPSKPERVDEPPPRIDTCEIIHLTVWDEFIEALILVESGGNASAMGRTNDVGVLQITPIMVAEANRLTGKGYVLADRLSRERSIELFNDVQAHYNPTMDFRKACKVWNPGAGEWYYERTMKKLYERL